MEGVGSIRLKVIIVHALQVAVCANSVESDPVGLVFFQEIRRHVYLNNVTRI